MAGYVLSPKAVRALIPLVRGPSNTQGTSAGGAGSVSYDGFPLPFAVSWSATAGNWVVWLPSLSTLVYVDSSPVTITGGSAAQNLPSGYYTVSGLSSSSTSLYLNITIPDPDQTGATTTAALSASAASSSTGNTVYSLTVATMATDANSDAKAVKQCLTSVVTIGGAGEKRELDETSIDENTNDEVEIKGWETGAPAETNSIGDILDGNGGTGEDAEQLICRQADGTLVYREIGTVTGGGTPFPSGTYVYFVGDVKYNISNHQLQQRVDTLDLSTGQVTQGQYAIITGGQAVPLTGG